MEVKDFLPKYPNIVQSKYDSLNPYQSDDERSGSFYEDIFRKKEFYENRLTKSEPFPKERGMLTKYQKTISRYFSGHTPYDQLLLVHSMGLGKCVFPDTLVYVKIFGETKQIPIQKIWSVYSSNIVAEIGTDKGFWATPSSKLTTLSYSEKEKITSGIVRRLYRQRISETIRIVTLINNQTISTTKRHKILTNKGWSNEITPELEVATVYNPTVDSTIQFVAIKSIKYIFYNGWVYDLEVDTYHSYLANDIVTHNTCSAIGVIEQIISEKNDNSLEKNPFTGAIVFAKGGNILDNFLRELVEKCTAGQYIPDNYKKLDDDLKKRRAKKKADFYTFRTFAKFAKKIKTMSDGDITSQYSNKIIVMDEVHNIRIQSKDNDEEEDSLETYNQFHRFLHLIKNCKILFLSGTPMKDDVSELASIGNLLLPLDDQFPTGKEFINEYMTEKEGVYSVKKGKIDDIKRKLKGRISFLREAESSVQKDFLGKKNYEGLKHFIVKPNSMSEFQNSAYEKAFGKGGEGKLYLGAREASLFVYPDGTWGKEGFNKYIKGEKSKGIKKKGNPVVYRMSDDLRKELRPDGATQEEILENIKNFSGTYHDVIKNILKTDGNCFVYSSLVLGSGAILFSLLLELFGYSKANGKENEKKLRYAILTNKTASSIELRRINDRFNNIDNINGEYIKVIIGSKAVSEGFSFKNVLFESVNTPHWNYSETAQALARGIRLGSHNDLIKNGVVPVVKILQPVSIPTRKKHSIDMIMYKTSEDKDISIKGILRILMECAFDCAMNYIQNYINGKKGSRECDYQSCEYVCDGIDMNMVVDGIPDEHLDYSTYQLYYANPNVSKVRKRIEQLFRENNNLTLTSIIKNLNNEFSEDDIKNALINLQEIEGENLSYEGFLDVYSSSAVKKIANGIEKLFMENFRLDLDVILNTFSEYTKFEVLSSLRSMINDNIVLYSRYGLPCYLREDRNIYFLVNNMSIQPDYYVDYYAKYPCVSISMPFDDIMKKIYSLSLPKIIMKICKSKNFTDFSKLIKTLPKNVQEFFIESSIVAKDRKDRDNEDGKELIDFILEYFKSYIKKVGKLWVCTFGETLRCKKEGDHKWKNCKEKYEKKLADIEKEREEKLKEDNPYGMIGKYNPEKGTFCIVDFHKEKEAQEKIKKKKGVEDVTKDKRTKYHGKVCGSGGWKQPELMKIAIDRLKLAYSDAFIKKYGGYSEDKIKKVILAEEKIVSTYSEKEIKDEEDMERLRRMLYWGITKAQGGNRGIKPICESIKEFFEKEGLLEVDNLCGVQGKAKKRKRSSE